MEQHRTRSPQRRQPPQAPLSPSGGPGEAEAGFPATVTVAPAASATPGAYPASGPGRTPGRRPRGRAVAPVVLALRRFPNPRLTGIGAGLFAAATMFLLACLDRLLLGGSEFVFGLLFLPVSALTALWVRPADLVTAPIGVPIAFAVGVIPVAGGTGGFGGQAMAVVTALAVHAGWLYGGTLVAGVIATVRKIRQMRERQRHLARTAQGARRPRT
ncbi:DUF6542 domain-containing protein [Streptomyces sp. NPDC005899]|uniref:DUF6542 domain-containing protein n=1 Tax=Streptomyces sp. NPDC005899 TaxID=3155716 RepID=UPI0033FDD465